MSAAYWAGVFSVPALVLGTAAAYVGLSACSWAVGKIGAWGLSLVTKRTGERHRVPIAATAYGARRVYMAAANRWGLVLLVDIDLNEVKEGARRLRTYPDPIRVNPRPGRKADPGEVPIS